MAAPAETKASDEAPKTKGGDVLQIDREQVISTIKPKLIATLAKQIEQDSDRASFLLLCRRVDATIRAWYHMQFDELLQLYGFFDPAVGQKRLVAQQLSAAQVDKLEQRFLQSLFMVLDKSNFKPLSSPEFDLCKGADYLLSLPIDVDHSKLDKTMLTKFLADHPQPVELPFFSSEYMIFRRGVGIDRTEGYFALEKVNALVMRVCLWFLSLVGLYTPTSKKVVNLSSEQTTGAPAGADGAAAVPGGSAGDTDTYERVRVQNMDITMENMLGLTHIQEPTFERMILLYRKSTPSTDKSKLGERGIVIKHFKHIPMADMEIILPEKKNPGLTPIDTIKIGATAVGGLGVFAGSLQSDLDIWMCLGILSAFLGYMSKVYFTFLNQMTIYQNLIATTVYDKQLDSGRGTLLHLCDDVIQQEVKEVIIAYFILMTTGKATEEVLDQRSEELIEDLFNEKVNFEVADAIAKLERLGIVSKDVNGEYMHQSLQRANDIIGVTTDEIVSQSTFTASVPS